MALGVRNLGVAIGCAGLLFTTSCAGILGPSTQAPRPGGPEILQATLEPSDGPKARVAVSQFVIRAGKGYETVGEGMSDMLAAALLQSHRYIVLERQALSKVLAEQDLGASGPIRPETAARIGHIEGAELLIMGTITEFEPGSAAGSWGSIMGGIIGVFGGSTQTSHLAIDLRIVDARSSRVVTATSIQAKATDSAGPGSLAGPELGAGLSAYARTPMEKAIRVAIQEGVTFIASKTPAQYFRYATGTAASSPVAPQPAITATPPNPASAAPPPAATAPSSETTPVLFVKPRRANMLSAPDTSSKVLAIVRKRTQMSVLDVKDQWYRVRLKDGKEGWIPASVTAPQPE